MPIYEYRCQKCMKAFEQVQKIGEAPPPCPDCNSHEVKKSWFAPALRFKGKGFYETDYKGKKKGE